MNVRSIKKGKNKKSRKDAKTLQTNDMIINTLCLNSFARKSCFIL